jgi:hypothetical protein
MCISLAFHVKPAKLDDYIRTCESLHAEEHYQLKILLQKYEQEYSTWNTDSISLQLMDPNCKLVHVHAYTVPRSLEQQLQRSKEII